MKSGAAQKYETMPLTEVLKFPFNQICDKDCMLFLWATTPLKPEAGQLIHMLEKKPFKFDYKTTIYWYKVRNGNRRGLGYWLSGDVEECLMFTRGDVRPIKLEDSNHVSAKVGIHSEKPREVYHLIERMGHAAFKSNASFVDVFARKKRRGWTTIGSKIDKKDVQVAIKELK